MKLLLGFISDYSDALKVSFVFSFCYLLSTFVELNRKLLRDGKKADKQNMLSLKLHGKNFGFVLTSLKCHCSVRRRRGKFFYHKRFVFNLQSKSHTGVRIEQRHVNLDCACGSG